MSEKSFQQPSPHTLPKFDFESESSSHQDRTSILLIPKNLLSRNKPATIDTPPAIAKNIKPDIPPKSSFRPKFSPIPSNAQSPYMSGPGYDTFNYITAVKSKTPVAPNAADELDYGIISVEEVPTCGEFASEDRGEGEDDFEVIGKGGGTESNGGR